MAIAQGEGELVARFVAPEPGQAATYQVRRPGPDDRAVVLSADLNEVAAFRAAVRFSRDGIGGVTVVGRTADGVERCALERSSDGVLEYLLPSVERYRGPDPAVQRALRRWDETLLRWSAQIGHPGVPVRPATAPAGGDLARYADKPGSADADRLELVDRADRVPTAAEIADAIQSSLMQMTVDINLTEVESLIRRTIEGTFGAMGATGLPARLPASAIADQVTLADQIGTVVAERMRGLLKPSLDDAADRVAAVVADHLGLLQRRAPTQSGHPETGEEVPQLLIELAETQRQVLSAVSSQVGIGSRIAGSVEHLDLQVQELREFSRMTAGALQSLTEQVAGLARRSEVAGERLASAVGQELDTFADRMRHQLVAGEAAAKRAASDGAVPEAVSRLTSRVARSEAQMEKLLQRLNEVVASESKRPSR
jgi:hypothetical protein